MEIQSFTTKNCTGDPIMIVLAPSNNQNLDSTCQIGEDGLHYKIQPANGISAFNSSQPYLQTSLNDTKWLLSEEYCHNLKNLNLQKDLYLKVECPSKVDEKPALMYFSDPFCTEASDVQIQSLSNSTCTALSKNEPKPGYINPMNSTLGATGDADNGLPTSGILMISLGVLSLIVLILILITCIQRQRRRRRLAKRQMDALRWDRSRV